MKKQKHKELLGVFSKNGELKELLAQLLHYQSEYKTNKLSKIKNKTKHPYEKKLIQKLRVTSAGVKEQEESLKWLEKEGIVEKKKNRWKLTRFGYYVSYNICEYYIQKTSGFWELAKRELPKLSGSVVLDIGCGGGVSFIAARDTGLFAESNLYGIDLCEESINAGKYILEKIKKRGEKIFLIKADGENLSDELPKADIVISKGTIHYMEMEKFICGLEETLRPGGMFLVSAPGWKTMARNLGEAIATHNSRGILRFSLALCNSIFEYLGVKYTVGKKIRGVTMKGVNRSFKGKNLEIRSIGEWELQSKGKQIVFTGKRKS